MSRPLCIGLCLIGLCLLIFERSEAETARNRDLAYSTTIQEHRLMVHLSVGGSPAMAFLKSRSATAEIETNPFLVHLPYLGAPGEGYFGAVAEPRILANQASLMQICVLMFGGGSPMNIITDRVPNDLYGAVFFSTSEEKWVYLKKPGRNTRFRQRVLPEQLIRQFTCEL